MNDTTGSIVKDSTWDEGAWTQVPNEIARDRALSLEAKGMILFLASHSVNYKIHLDSLKIQTGIGREKLQRILKELKEAGYLRTEPTWQMVDGRNRRGPNQYFLGRYPRSVDTTGFQAVEVQAVGDQAPEVQEAGVQRAGNQGDIKKNNSKKNNTKKTKEESGAAAASPARSRGTRLSEDFQVTPEMVQWCRTNFPNVDGKYETEKFREHFLSAPGQRGVKLRWDLTWRKWIRTAAEQQHSRRPGRNRTLTDSKTGAMMDR